MGRDFRLVEPVSAEGGGSNSGFFEFDVSQGNLISVFARGSLIASQGKKSDLWLFKEGG